MQKPKNCYVDVILCIFASDPIQPKQFKFLADYIDYKIHFPTSDDISQKTIRTAAELLYKYTGLTARINGTGWVDLEQNLIIDSPEHLSVVYLAMIPEVVEPKKGVWWELEKFVQVELSPEVDYIIKNFMGIRNV